MTAVNAAAATEVAAAISALMPPSAAADAPIVAALTFRTTVTFLPVATRHYRRPFLILGVLEQSVEPVAGLLQQTL
jgi:hypothetical protein